MCSLACALVIIAAPKAALGQSGTVLAEVLEDWSDLKASILQLDHLLPSAVTDSNPTSVPISGDAPVEWGFPGPGPRPAAWGGRVWVVPSHGAGAG